MFGILEKSNEILTVQRGPKEMFASQGSKTQEQENTHKYDRNACAKQKIDQRDFKTRNTHD